jgi:hypothetical protein
MWRLARTLMLGGAGASLLSGLILCSPGCLGETAWGQTPTADEIVARMNERDLERKASLERYGSERTYRIQYHGPLGDRSAEVLARMDFSAPDQKRFTVLSESGSNVFCHKVLRKLMEGEQENALEANHVRTMLSMENYNSTLVGEEESDGIKTWVLEVSPKVNSKFSYKGKVWVSMDDYAVVRIVGSPARNPTWMTTGAKFDYRYARNGRFWLPQRNVTVSHVRMGGEVTLTVDYGAYDIMTTPQPASVSATRENRPAIRKVSGLAMAAR